MTPTKSGYGGRVDRPALDAVALHAALDERWARIDVVDETASTNADLIADLTAPDRSLLVAEDQTAGRGRLDRAWVTPARAGITASFLFRPAAPVSTWGWLPLLAGLALRYAVSETFTALKWPNDLLDEQGHKLAGILAQTTGDAVVIGIGLNVTTTADELPVETASSMQLSGAPSLDRTKILIDMARNLDHRMAQWEDVNGDAAACGLAADYASACATLGQAVRIATLAGDDITGHAVQIAADGRLLVDVDGELIAVGAGDVQHLRNA